MVRTFTYSSMLPSTARNCLLCSSGKGVQNRSVGDSVAFQVSEQRVHAYKHFLPLCPQSVWNKAGASHLTSPPAPQRPKTREVAWRHAQQGLACVPV